MASALSLGSAVCERTPWRYARTDGAERAAGATSSDMRHPPSSFSRAAVGMLCAVDPRSLRPPLTYADQFRDAANASLTLDPVGYAVSPYKERFGTPRQATVRKQIAGGEQSDGAIQLTIEGASQLLQDLDGFSHIWVIAHMHLNRGWKKQVQPPRGPKGV